MSYNDWELWPDFFLEFEDDQGNTVDDDDEEEEYSVDDEEETTDDQPEETPTEEPTTDDGGGDDEYSMDDVEGDDTPVEDPADDQGAEEPAEGEEDYEIPDDEGSDDATGGEGDAEGGDDFGGDDEYSMDDDGGEDDTSGSDDVSDDTSSMSNEPASDPASEKLRELESVVFDTLSDTEKRLKIKDLKELYTTIYKKCDTIYNSLADIKRDEETIQIIEYISNTLIDLKRYVGDYIINLFDVKTYVENLAQLQKYIMIFTAINQVFEQIRTEKSK